jgi:hypothetical protein
MGWHFEVYLGKWTNYQNGNAEIDQFSKSLILMKYSDYWKLDLMGCAERLILIFSDQAQNILLVVVPVIRKEN